MSEENNPIFDPLNPIPSELHSEYHEGLFEECLNCERPLLDQECFYEIQKIFKHNRTIWEHAICNECGENLLDSYSDESLLRIRDFMNRMELYADSTRHCHLCETDVETGEEHLIAALCKRDQMLFSPMILCIGCLEQLNGLLSRETRDNWDHFIKENVPGMPAQETPVPDFSLPGIG